MRGQPVAVLLIVSLAGFAVATAGSAQDEPTPVVTVTATVTETVRVNARYQGWTIRTWAKKTAQARRDANARGRTIQKLKRANRLLSHAKPPWGNHWLERAFYCIHGFERGADGWATNTGNGYENGLQMDKTFRESYGWSWAFDTFGPSYRWPAVVQMAVAIRAWTTRGFRPWPNTARFCGLL